MILLDTQQWVWLKDGNPRLIASVPGLIAAGDGAISAISVWEIALLGRTLPFAHEDPADCFIAATAHRLGVPLATSDARLIGLPWLKTLS